MNTNPKLNHFKVIPVMNTGLTGIELKLSLMALQELATANEDLIKFVNPEWKDKYEEELIDARVAKDSITFKKKVIRKMLGNKVGPMDDNETIDLDNFFENVRMMTVFISKITGDIPSRQSICSYLFE